MSKSIYDLSLHEFVIIDSNNFEATVATRVPGGWIYTTSYANQDERGMTHSQSSVFVPYSDEFMEKKKTTIRASIIR